MSALLIDGVAKRYGDVAAVEDIHLEVRGGEWLTLLGPSGCGKTTILRLIAGFTHPTSGRILIDGEDVTRTRPQKRRIGMVFQDYALFPHLTVAENVGFALRERGARPLEIRKRVTELLELVKLPGVEQRYPSQLSGGQQQRVALARAVAYTPRILLMDEPLSALDLKLREAMQLELRQVQRELRITTVYVTHDQLEAMVLSDRIAVLNQGRVVQVGTSEEIYCWPKTKFVAHFVGRINFLQGRVVGGDGTWGIVETAGARVRVATDGLPSAGQSVSIAVRPERLQVEKPGSASLNRNVVAGVLVARRFVGNLFYLFVEVSGGPTVMVDVHPKAAEIPVGEVVHVTWDPLDATLLADT